MCTLPCANSDRSVLPLDKRETRSAVQLQRSKQIEYALNDGEQVGTPSQSKIRHSECVQGTRIEKGKGRMPIGTKHTALCPADVHSNQTDVARNEQAEAAA